MPSFTVANLQQLYPHLSRASINALAIQMRLGVPMTNRLRMLGAPGAIVAGNTATIGDDIYEFNASTPPSGGTAGSIWVYQGANSAESRANLINAINGIVDAATITYDGAVVEAMVASLGVTTGDVVVQSSYAVGGSVPIASATATACTETLATASDIWDQATMYGGVAAGVLQHELCSITITAAMIAKGDVQARFPFAPSGCILSNRMRQQDEEYVPSGYAVSLTLAGSTSPNNQDGDVIDILAFA